MQGQKTQELLTVELPPENTGVRCGKALGNLTGSSRVALKSVKVSFISDSRQIVMALVLLDTERNDTNTN